MSSDYGRYIAEREGKGIVEDERGFATYLLLPEYVYLEDVYVKPEYRQQGAGTAYMEAVSQIGRDSGVKKIVTTVKPSAKNSTISMAAILAVGFQLDSSSNDAIYFYKILGDLNG